MLNVPFIDGREGPKRGTALAPAIRVRWERFFLVKLIFSCGIESKKKEIVINRLKQKSLGGDMAGENTAVMRKHYQTSKVRKSDDTIRAPSGTKFGRRGTTEPAMTRVKKDKVAQLTSEGRILLERALDSRRNARGQHGLIRSAADLAGEAYMKYSLALEIEKKTGGRRQNELQELAERAWLFSKFWRQEQYQMRL
jgi:hypothetical protein